MKFIFYSSLNDDPIITRVKSLTHTYDADSYNEVLAMLMRKAQKIGFRGNLYKAYLCYLITSDENLFSLAAEREGLLMDEQLYALALRDMAYILKLFSLDIIKEEIGRSHELCYLDTLYEIMIKEPSEEELRGLLAAYYKQNGAGQMNQFRAFKWDKTEGLTGILNCDPIQLKDLIGCDYQKQVLLNNTESFLAGKAANNVLLFGDSGTGKSSSVKALLNAYYKQGLRIIDLSKTDFLYFNKILAKLRNRGLKFIIFLDDLSFEEFETEYKYMKALIEGGVEVKPSNVLIYATSNRRHLIRETWNERQGEDVHISDTQQEKLSLADRFGIALTYTSPNQNAYLEIVFELAKLNQIDIPQNVLREKAIQWGLVHGGRSGRVARQFINSLI